MEKFVIWQQPIMQYDPLGTEGVYGPYAIKDEDALFSSEGENFLDACKNYIVENGHGEIRIKNDGEVYACGRRGERWFPTLEDAKSEPPFIVADWRARHLVETLNDYCERYNCRCVIKDFDKDFYRSDLAMFQFKYVDTLEGRIHDEFVECKNVYKAVIERRNYYFGVWEIGRILGDEAFIRTHWHNLNFFELELDDEGFYREKKYVVERVYGVDDLKNNKSKT